MGYEGISPFCSPFRSGFFPTCDIRNFCYPYFLLTGSGVNFLFKQENAMLSIRFEGDTQVRCEVLRVDMQISGPSHKSVLLVYI